MGCMLAAFLCTIGHDELIEDENITGAYMKIWTRWKLPSQQIQAYLKENNLESSTLIFNFEGVQFGWKMSSKQPEVTFTNNHKEKTVAK